MIGFPSDVAELSCKPEHLGDGVIHSDGGVNPVCHFITCNRQTPSSILRGWHSYIWAFTAEKVWWELLIAQDVRICSGISGMNEGGEMGRREVWGPGGFIPIRGVIRGPFAGGKILPTGNCISFLYWVLARANTEGLMRTLRSHHQQQRRWRIRSSRRLGTCVNSHLLPILCLNLSRVVLLLLYFSPTTTSWRLDDDAISLVKLGRRLSP